MSDALKYLMKLKPEAMQHYFSFIKQSGEHLDERTRAIISIITKVDNQTEKGLRQYVKRGLSLGITPAEIVDALFVAFPSLGLSKIVWAVDILLDMEIPGFELENIKVPAGWHKLKMLSELAEGVSYIDGLDGKDLIVFRQEDQFSIYDRLCPHQSTRLPADCEADKQIRCPAHQWLFSLEDGQCLEKGSRPLVQYESKLENDTLYALW